MMRMKREFAAVEFRVGIAGLRACWRVRDTGICGGLLPLRKKNQRRHERNSSMPEYTEERHGTAVEPKEFNEAIEQKSLRRSRTRARTTKKALVSRTTTSASALQFEKRSRQHPQGVCERSLLSFKARHTRA